MSTEPSPHVLAWELFNEVQYTDAVRNGQTADVAAWHREMAAFLRAQDPNRHLVTSSSDLGLAGVFDAVDYLQPHSYPPDPLASAAALPPGRGRPIFFGEFGPQSNLRGDAGTFLHAALWASIASEASEGPRPSWRSRRTRRRSSSRAEMRCWRDRCRSRFIDTAWTSAPTWAPTSSSTSGRTTPPPERGGPQGTSGMRPAMRVPFPGAESTEPTRVLGDFLRDVMRRNGETFRLFGPDETESNRLGAVYDVTAAVLFSRVPAAGPLVQRLEPAKEIATGVAQAVAVAGMLHDPGLRQLAQARGKHARGHSPTPDLQIPETGCHTCL